MVIVKPVKIRINDIKNNNLHSSMVIVKHKSKYCREEVLINLHSSMVIVKRNGEINYLLWFTTFTFQYGYSKTEDYLHCDNAYYIFTFQYGYSKTICLILLSVPFVAFTFQYGYSKTKAGNIKKCPVQYLHSSMVIVKLISIALFVAGFFNLHSSMVIVKHS